MGVSAVHRAREEPALLGRRARAHSQGPVAHGGELQHRAESLQGRRAGPHWRSCLAVGVHGPSGGVPGLPPRELPGHLFPVGEHGCAAARQPPGARGPFAFDRSGEPREIRCPRRADPDPRYGPRWRRGISKPWAKAVRPRGGTGGAHQGGVRSGKPVAAHHVSLQHRRSPQADRGGGPADVEGAPRDRGRDREPGVESLPEAARGARVSARPARMDRGLRGCQHVPRDPALNQRQQPFQLAKPDVRRDVGPCQRDPGSRAQTRAASRGGGIRNAAQSCDPDVRIHPLRADQTVPARGVPELPDPNVLQVHVDRRTVLRWHPGAPA